MTKYLSSLPDRHPSVAQVAQWLELDPNLAGDARRVSELCAQFTGALLGMVPDGPELTAGLRKLVEAKDCLSRATLNKS